MADKIEDAEFWLPSEFLTDEDILMDNKENFNNYGLVGSNSAVHCFPYEFPHHYGSSLLSSPVESSLGSAETESDEEDSLLTELTRQLALSQTTQKVAAAASRNHGKGWALSSSPQSTLTQAGSWSGRSTVSSSGSPNGPSQVSSPPTTPLSSRNDAWDLIYQAAGQVARLKINGGDGRTRPPGPPASQKWHIPPQPPKTCVASAFHQGQWVQIRGDEMLKQAGCGMLNGEVKRRTYEQELSQVKTGVGVGAGGWNVNGHGLDPPKCAWPAVQVQQRNQLQPGKLSFGEESYLGNGYGYGYGFGSTGGVSGGGGGGVKKERTGTGVFLPRRYGNVNYPNHTSDSRKKPGSSPANWHPTRIMQDPNRMGNVAQLHRARITLPSVSDYETLVAQRNALLSQQRRSIGSEASISHDICLPQEWTY